MEHSSRHQCLVYDGPPSQKLGLLAVLLRRKLDEGYRCLYLNSPPMVAGMGSTLAALGTDVTREIASERLLLSSETVSPGEHFDSQVMLDKLEEALDQALRDGFRGLWATGDMSWEFGPRRDFSKLLEYEWGLEDLFRRRKELAGICQYHRDSLPPEAMRQGLLVHPSIVINDTLSRINPHYLETTLPAGLPAATFEMDKTIAVLCRNR